MMDTLKHIVGFPIVWFDLSKVRFYIYVELQYLHFYYTEGIVTLYPVIDIQNLLRYPMIFLWCIVIMNYSPEEKSLHNLPVMRGFNNLFIPSQWCWESQGDAWF